MADQDFYAALGVKRTATPDEIKRAYRKLVRKYHPDVARGADATARFKAISAAYEVLRDPEKRTLYDQHRANWENPPRPDPRPNWDGGYDFRREDVADADPTAFRQFFESAFGERGGLRTLQAQISVDLADIMAGADKTVMLGQQRIKVHIPKGVRPGAHLLLKGQGAQGADLILEVNVRPHPTYRIEGHDLIADLAVTPWEAALGASLDLPTPGGRVRMKVPANARSGQKLRLKGRGLPGVQPGDLYAVIMIVNPPVKSKEGRALYEQMARDMPFDPRAGMKG